MDSYTILRNNKEYGPYTLKELLSLGLFTTDLIWVEGQSVSWRNASEFDDLKPVIKNPQAVNNGKAKTPAPVNAIQAESVLQEEPAGITSVTSISESLKAGVINYDQSYSDDSQISFEAKKKIKPGKRDFSFNYNFLGLGVLLIGAMMGAFIVKQMVATFGKERTIVAEAKEISSQGVPVSITTHTAEAESFSKQTVTNQVAPPIAKTPIEERIKPQPKAVIAGAPKIDSVKKVAVSKEPETNLTAIKDNSTTVSTKSIKEEEGNAANEEVKKPKSSNSSLEITANDYKVGMLGGVSGLQISIRNKGSQNIDNAVVEVEFLRPNGTVVKTEILSVQNVAVGTSKTIAVPSSSRGVKVRYRVVSTNAKEEIIATDNM